LQFFKPVNKKYSYVEKIWREEAIAAFPVLPPPLPIAIHVFAVGTVEQLSFH